MKCIICREEKPESEEHIIPEALGNRRLITKRVCKECNNKLGTNVDNYLTDHLIIRIIRKNEDLPGKSRQGIKIFSGVETNKETEREYIMKNDEPVLLPKMTHENDGHIRIEAENENDCFELFKKAMKKEGLSDEEIISLWKKANIREVEPESSLKILKDAPIDLPKWKLSAIKIAYEYAFSMLGEKYIEDEVAILFSRELKKIAYSMKKDINISSEIVKFVTCQTHGNGIEELLFKIKENLPKDVLHIIFMIKQDGCLYCILNLFVANIIANNMADIMTFKIKITKNADDYKVPLPITLVLRDGTVLPKNLTQEG